MRDLGLILLCPLLLAAADPTAGAVREMTLTTPDGFVLKGTLTLPAGRGRHPVVVLAHQFGADRTGWAPLAQRLTAAGLATLALDLRGHGQSTRKGELDVKATADFLVSAKAIGFDRIPADLAQAAAWVRRQPGIDGSRLGLAGSSIGAYASLLAAPRVRPLAVLALSPAGNGGFGQDGLPALARATEQAKAAIMVLASRQDGDAMANASALQAIPGVYTRLVDGKEHGFDYLAAQSDTMAVFLATYLKDRIRRGTPATPEAAGDNRGFETRRPARARAAREPEANQQAQKDLPAERVQ